MEPQPTDSSITTSQVEMEDPNPSEEKEAPITVVDLTNEEAIENPTRSTTPIEDWEVTAFQGEEGVVAAEKEDESNKRPPPKKILEAPVTVVDLTNEEAIENPTRLTNPIEDWCSGVKSPSKSPNGAMLVFTGNITKWPSLSPEEKQISSIQMLVISTTTR
jgi:hypothetical protein